MNRPTWNRTVARLRLAVLSATLVAMAICAVAEGSAQGSPPARKGQLVHFVSIAGPHSKAVLVRGYLTLPAVGQGRGLLPAVVLMHGCGGVQVSSHRWAEQLARWGFAALVVDSFSTRRIREVCDQPERLLSTQRTGDAYGALQYLQSVRGIDPDRIGVMGWSHGGSSALWAVDREWSMPFRPHPWVQFRAAAVFYPGCSQPYTEFTAPVLISAGAADNWTPAVYCRRLAKNIQDSTGPIRLVIYPGATHAFDAVRTTVLAYGHRLEYNPVATQGALGNTLDFLTKYLKSR